MLECQTFQKNRFVRQLFLHVLLVLAWPQVFSAIRVKRQEAQQWLEHKAVPKKCCYYCLLYREQRSWLQDSVSGQCYLPDWKQKKSLRSSWQKMLHVQCLALARVSFLAGCRGFLPLQVFTFTYTHNTKALHSSRWVGTVLLLGSSSKW